MPTNREPDIATDDSAQLSLLVPPPRLYVGTWLSGLAISLFVPVRLLQHFDIAAVSGLLLFALSSGLARWSFVTMRRSETSAAPDTHAAQLVTDGPFRYSRNPIYVAMTGLYLGLTLLLNSLWPLLLVVPLLAVMEWGVIRREERYLSQRFGPPYDAYRSRVRRWL